jgi:alkaline phosphatase D
MKYVDLYRRGYVLIDADHERVQGEVWHVPTVDAQNPGETYSAGFSNVAGANGLQAASGPSPERASSDPA